MLEMELEGLGPDERAKMEESARMLLRTLEGKRVDANDKKHVWVVNKHGVRDVVEYGYYRTYMMRYPEEGYRLLGPDEVKDEQEKVAQSHAVLQEKKRLWGLLAPHEQDRLKSPSDADLRVLQQMTKGRDEYAALSAEALQARIKQLETELDAHTAGKKVRTA